jgi:hypothetical protein
MRSQPPSPIWCCPPPDSLDRMPAPKKPAAEPHDVPFDQMSVERPFDSAEYLDGDPPTYAGKPAAPTEPASE